MSPRNKRLTFWLWGPLVALVLASIALLHKSNSHLFVFCAIAALGFMIIAPLVQGILLNTSRYRARRDVAGVIAFAAVVALVCVAQVAGAITQ